MSSSRRTFQLWYLSAPLIWVLGIPHFVPLLGVYMLLGGNREGALLLMLTALAATGGVAGIVQAFAVSPWALLVTPVSFLLGYAPAPLLLFLREPGRPLIPDDSAIGLTFVTSLVCITLGQWLLSRLTPSVEPEPEPERA